MKNPNELIKSQSVVKNPDRRLFMKHSSLSVAAAGLLLIGCKDDVFDPMPDTVNLGSGDMGILNYAYALEQLEAAFYAAVLQGGYYNGANAEEKQIMVDLEKHERAHREFLKAAINSGSTAISELEFNFTSIDFNSRDSVLSAAKTFEDLGVAAYNGAGKFLQNPDLLVVAGKIVSVEARHAAAIRDLINPGSDDFAGDDLIDANGLERTLSFSEVLTAASAFVITPIDFTQLPS